MARRIADSARFVDVLAGKAEIGGGRINVPAGNVDLAIATVLRYLAPLLCSVVFVGDPALCAGLER